MGKYRKTPQAARVRLTSSTFWSDQLAVMPLAARAAGLMLSQKLALRKLKLLVLRPVQMIFKKRPSSEPLGFLMMRYLYMASRRMGRMKYTMPGRRNDSQKPEYFSVYVVAKAKKAPRLMQA